MPRFFFDTDDGVDLLADDEGQDVPDVESLRILAVDALPDIAREVMTDGGERTVSVCVRDEAGNSVFEASLSLKTRWLRPPAAL